jgi:hypothetical protein
VFEEGTISQPEIWQLRFGTSTGTGRSPFFVSAPSGRDRTPSSPENLAMSCQSLVRAMGCRTSVYLAKRGKCSPRQV